jgi:osomolarity two-component system phosphorelay intermediate protein YPD1
VDGRPEPDDKICLARIAEALVTVKHDTTELEKIMTQFFGPAE